MKYETRKQRAKLYRIAAVIISNTTHSELVSEIEKELGENFSIEFVNSKFCCDVLAGLAQFDNHADVKVNMFPEFFLFCPVGKEQEGYTGWWDDNDRQTRATAFLLCAEMCEN